MNDYGVAMTMVHVVVRPVPVVIVIVVRAAVPMMMVAAMVPSAMVPSATVPSATMMPSAAVRASTMVMPTVAMAPAEAATTMVMRTAKATTSVMPTSKATAVMPTAEAAAVMSYHAVSNQHARPAARSRRPNLPCWSQELSWYSSGYTNRRQRARREDCLFVYCTRVQSKATMRRHRATRCVQPTPTHQTCYVEVDCILGLERLLCPKVASRERPTVCQQLADA